jgi:hypothetical protein
MKNGNQFRLKVEIVGVEAGGESRPTPVHVPAGSVVSVLSGPHELDNGMIEVNWADRKLMMFREELRKRGDPV